MPKAKISNGLTTHYQQVGQGRDIVMIHGLFSNLAFWYLSVLPVLSRSFRVTVYDLRGHGYTDMPPSGYRTHEMASDLLGLLDHLKIEQAHLVGHSFGGAVGLHFTSRYPERVRSITLADARVPSLQPVFPPRTARHWRILEFRLRRAGIDVTENLPRVAYSFLEELARLQQQRNRLETANWGAAALLRQWNSNSRVAQRWGQLMRTTTAPAELGDSSDLTVERIRQITRPLLAVYGEYSGCLPTLRELTRNLPACTEVVIPRVGHFYPVIKPRTFVKKLDQFIVSLEP